MRLTRMFARINALLFLNIAFNDERIEKGTSRKKEGRVIESFEGSFCKIDRKTL
jgi:hypothetical protein